jgi:Flp pilus assembly protein TadD
LFSGAHLDETIVAFRQTVKIEPDHAGAWYGLSVCYRVSGRVDEAEAAFEHARKLKPVISGEVERLLRSSE